MAISIIIGGEDETPLTSATGWAAFREWVDDLDVKQYPELVSFVDHSVSQELEDLQDNLNVALEDDAPDDDDVLDIANAILEALDDRDDNAMSIMLTDGVGSEDNDSPDEWHTS